METQLPDGRIINKKTPAGEIRKILDAAEKLGLSQAQQRVLKGILKVVTRLGSAAIILLDDLFSPRDAEAPTLPPGGPAGPEGPEAPRTPNAPGESSGASSGFAPSDRMPPTPEGPDSPATPGHSCVWGRKC